MTIKEYQDLAMRTNDGKCRERLTGKCFDHFVGTEPYDPGNLLNGALGLTGEAGEVADMIKKYMFHGHLLNRGEFIKELGDCAWYLAFLCTAIDVSLEEVLIENIEKLKKRYPEGFSELASINRAE